MASSTSSKSSWTSSSRQGFVAILECSGKGRQECYSSDVHSSCREPCKIRMCRSALELEPGRIWIGMWMLALIGMALASPCVVAQGSSGHEVHVVYLGAKCDKLEHEVIEDHHQLLASAAGSIEKAKEAILYHYHRSFRGFAAKLAPHHVEALRASDRVLSIFKSKSHAPATTNSWEFLGVYGSKGVESGKSSKFPAFGNQSDVIIGFFDTGYWPEAESFNDKGLGPVPARWRGDCVAGENFTARTCNNKVIGARYYPHGAEAALGKRIPDDLYSPRDVDSHGTHTASTAAGRAVSNVSFFGIAPGTATGGAPGARIAVYKVCWLGAGCNEADVLAAFDDAVADGVDIVSMSLQRPEVDSILSDGLALGTLHGALAGILVSASAGNIGPGPRTVSNSSPWVLTVAASTTDRELVTYLRLGNGVTIPGQWVINVLNSSAAAPLILSTEIGLPGADAENITLCANNTLDTSKAQGKVLVCYWNYDLAPVPFDDISSVAGVVFILTGGKRPISQNFPVPALVPLPVTIITEESADALLKYNRLTRAPVAQILHTTTVFGFKPAPLLAAFSSRGPSNRSPDVIKPDITAPGVNILAAWPPVVDPFQSYNFATGTSMSCPHISGIAALIKAAHPEWGPAIIKSAIMTTAYVVDNTKKSLREYPELKAADEYAFGSGHVKPVSALDPGLAYDTDPLDYLDFLCAFENATILNAVFRAIEDPDRLFVSCPSKPPQSFNLNYPSISLTTVSQREVVRRVVTNVGPRGRVQYTAQVVAPKGVQVSVKPNKLQFEEVGQRLEFKVEFSVKPGAFTKDNNIRRGSLTWTDGKGGHTVRSPIVVKIVRG